MFLLAMTGFANAQNQASDDPLVAQVETAIVTQTNDFRSEHDLRPVRKDAELTETIIDEGLTR